MEKAPHYRIFIKEGDKTYLLCRLWQQKSDVSLMLHVYPREGGSGGTLGKFKIESNPFDIRYDQVSEPVDIEHTSIHATGQSHAKMKDGTRTVTHDKEAVTIPLEGLKTSKHLTTLLCRAMSDEDVREMTRQNDVPLERDSSQKFTTLDVIAIPASANINFSFNWDMENDKPVSLNINTHRLRFKDFDVLVFTRHSDQFDTAPPKTIQLPDMNDKVPFVTKIDADKLTVNLSQLSFSEMITPVGDNPYEGFTVISATPKFL